MSFFKRSCKKCGVEYHKDGLTSHERKCEGIKICPQCGKEYTGRKKTCGYACANKYFRSGENHPNWKPESYRSTCFLYHEKKCVICGEEKILAVHHMNEDKKDNRPENLIPLCPTHHQYFHSRYRSEVEPQILKYLEEKFLGVAQ